MKPTHWLSVLAIAVTIHTAAAAPATGPTAGPVARYAIEAKFEDVRDDVLLAIQAHGLVVDHTSHIQVMLERTGKDLGTSEAIFRQAEAFSFCSAVVSREMMRANAHLIALCPYVIAVYVVAQEPNRVYVAYRRPPPADDPASRKALAQVQTLLDGIVREALGLK